jgi:hypothetical protein
MLWDEWINALSQFHVGVHLMRTHAAGTFAMNCSFHGIPCIGYDGLDTQRILHPALTVGDGDIKEARRLAVRLKEEPGFYDECSNETQTLFDTQYKEKAWLERWNEFWSDK